MAAASMLPGHDASPNPLAPPQRHTMDHSFPSLRSIVVCFLEAIPLLLSVVGMLCFFIFIFGVTGTELLGGMYHRVRHSMSMRAQTPAAVRLPPVNDTYIHAKQATVHPLPAQAACVWCALTMCVLLVHFCQVCVDADGRKEQSANYEGEYGCGSRHCPEGYTCKVVVVVRGGEGKAVRAYSRCVHGATVRQPTPGQQQPDSMARWSKCVICADPAVLCADQQRAAP